MTVLAITLILSFILGCLTSVGEQRAYRIFNTQYIGGALLYVLAFLSAFGISLFAIAIMGTVLGTYTHQNNRLVLISYATGFALLTVFKRIRSSRRQ